MNYWTQNKDNIYVAAHRGFCSDYPENTMLAFKKALELKSPVWIECVIDREEAVLPMIPAGGTVADGETVSE